ncbi:MAG: SPOR domain-containing protein, partial [Rhodobacteraceae bacterium]|nr:SPOR domain-containing protein [Paracoccaceae bacterium]
EGTAQGWAVQDQVGTREVPSRLVADTARAEGKTGGGRRVSVSSKSQGASDGPAKTATMTRRYVQVGTFGQPANAEGASSRLSRLGLPVARSNITKGGQPLQIVLAGPFASAGEALSAARRAGFGDAFIR